MEFLVILKNPVPVIGCRTISDHKQTWGYEENHWKGPGRPYASGR